MKPMMHPDMIEATRLTREGRLTEATALLQRMLQSGTEPDVRTTDGPCAAAADSPRAGAAPIIELTPEMFEVSAPRRSAPTGWVASALAVTSTRVQAQAGRKHQGPTPARTFLEKMEPDSSSRGSSQGDGRAIGSGALMALSHRLQTPLEHDRAGTCARSRNDACNPPPGSPGNPSPVRPK